MAAATTRKASNAIPKMRLTRDGFITEIIRGRATGLYHYTISKDDSAQRRTRSAI
jgi:hypothetical protein